MEHFLFYVQISNCCCRTYKLEQAVKIAAVISKILQALLNAISLSIQCPRIFKHLFVDCDVIEIGDNAIKHGDVIYIFSNEASPSFESAKDTCEKYGGSIVQITRSERNLFEETLKKKYIRGKIFVFYCYFVVFIILLIKEIFRRSKTLLDNKFRINCIIKSIKI